MKRVRLVDDGMSNDINVFANGCLVHLHIRCWGASSKMSNELLSEFLAEDKQESRGVMRAVYDLIGDKSKLKAIESMRGSVKKIVNSFALPFPIDGLSFVPKSAISTIDEELKRHQILFFDAVNEFLSTYNEQVHDYSVKNPELYNSNNYPSVQTLRERFQFQWSYRAFAVPGGETGILSPEIYQEEMDKFKDEMEKMKTMAVSVIGKQFLTKIDLLKTQCLGGNINSGSVNNLNAFLDKFDTHWNGFFAHKQLKAMIEDVKDSMAGTTGDVIRADPEFRLMLGKRMSDIADDFRKVGSSDARLKRALDI